VARTTEFLQRVNTDPELGALRQLCIETLLACPEERVFFNDARGRVILVSAGSLAAMASGGTPEDTVGKTAHEMFSEEIAKVADADERHILETGETVVGKVRRMSIPGHSEMWMQTTKMALRDSTGAIVGTFGISRDLTAQIEAENALAHQALHDGLTGLPNRALILDRIDQMLARTRRSHGQCAAMFLDLDNFKDINDTLGHHAGDELLVAVADRLSNAVRPSDTVGRLGGDEFVVLVDGESMDAGPDVVAERILDVLRTPFEIAASPLPLLVSASIGIATGNAQTADQLLREADIALYQAKDAGKRCAMTFAPTMQTSAQVHRKLAVDLEAALEKKQFFLLYQPTIDLQTGEFRGVEALLRWQHPEEGVVQPDDFIPELETSGLIVPVGAWVLEEACRQGAAWVAAGHHFSVSVNVSAKQIIRDRILTDVEHGLQLSGFDPTLLILELTETTLMHDVAETVSRLELLRGIGVRIAVDDFGTGYSSLAYLRQFPIDILKIDRSFVSGISDSNEAAALVHTLVELGRALNLETIAEGVEDDAQRLRLQAENVDTGQGFLFSKPIDVAAIDQLLYNQVA
jgi:diguanylate cyclase (GGDEF)-like protein/PAS domain S-box-containing protein